MFLGSRDFNLKIRENPFSVYHTPEEGSRTKSEGIFTSEAQMRPDSHTRIMIKLIFQLSEENNEQHL